MLEVVSITIKSFLKKIRMCLLGSCLLFFGFASQHRVIKNEALKNPPDKVYCMSCEDIHKGTYIVNENICYYCFIPCCCYQTDSNPKLGCSKCYTIYKSPPIKCNNCEIYNVVSTKYCPNCGSSREVN